MIKAPQKASLWWLFTSDGDPTQNVTAFCVGRIFYPHHF